MLVFAKSASTLILFGISAALVGDSFFGHKVFRLNHPVLMAQNAVTQESTILAVHEEKLNAMNREAQAGIDDRKELHAAIATITDRINVDEAQAATAAKVFGFLFSLFTGTSTLIAFLEFRRRKKEDPKP